MKAIVLVVAALVFPVAAQSETWTGTGPRGVTVTGSGTCVRANATLTCNRAGVVTGPNGRAADHVVNRVTNAAGTVKTLTTTGVRGRSVTSVRTRTRGN